MTKPLVKFMAKSNNGEDITFYRNHQGVNYSACPPQTFLTFEYWIYMVPQYKPTSVLMLGYGAGTVAGLIRLIWGDVPITAVDIEPPVDGDRYGVTFVQEDAKTFVTHCENFDAVLVDVFDNETVKNCEFVTDPDFVENLERIGNYLIINSLNLDMSAYQHLRLRGINQASGSGVLIYYYETRNKIPFLHPIK